MQVVSSDEVKWMDVSKDNDHFRVGVYLGSPGKMAQGPEAFMTCLMNTGATIQPHFHDVDQFQVFMGGTGNIGRHHATPITVQYADAFGPYGPIVAKETGFQYLVLRPAAAAGHFEMPERADLIPGKLGRTLSFHLGDEPDQSGLANANVKLIDAQADGLMIEERCLPCDATVQIGNDGCAQYVVVCAGSMAVNEKTLVSHSLVYFEREDAPITAVAGNGGVRLLLLRFSRPSQRLGSDPGSKTDRASDRKYDLPASYREH